MGKVILSPSTSRLPDGTLFPNTLVLLLVEELDKQKRSDVLDNCDLRQDYLKRAIEISNISAAYFDAKEVFRTDLRFVETLDVTLEYVERIKVESPEIYCQIVPANCNSASGLYLPLEIAESVYLSKFFGVNVKFGPITEKLFDYCIMKVQKELNTAYTSVRCPLGPVRPGYLSTEKAITTRMKDSEVKKLLEEDSEYRNYVESYLKPFQVSGELLLESAIRMKNSMRVR